MQKTHSRRSPVLVISTVAILTLIGGACGDSGTEKGGSSSPGQQRIDLPEGSGAIIYSTQLKPFRTNNLGSEHRTFEMAVKKDEYLSFKFPNASADGKTIVFEGHSSLQKSDLAYSQLYTMSSKGGKPKRVSKFKDLSPTRPAISPDGSRIAFQATKVGSTDNPEIYIMDTKGGKPKRLTRNEGQYSDNGPDFSPDGKSIVFSRYASCEYEAQMSDKCDIGIAVVDADGGKVKVISKEEILGDNVKKALSNSLDPDWSPDGKWIAFVAVEQPGKTTDSQLFIVDPDGKTAPKRLSEFDGGHWEPVWSPDSESIAFAGQIGTTTGPRNIYVVSADGKELTKPSTNPEALLESPAWVAVDEGSQ